MGVVAYVMDGMYGRAAEGVPVTLHREVDGCWQEQASAVTDPAGQVPPLHTAPARGRYRLALDLDSYFAALGVEPFQSRVEVTFRIFTPDEEIGFLLMITSSSSTVCRMAISRQQLG